MKIHKLMTVFVALLLVAASAAQPGLAAQQTYDINTLAGKVASLNGTDGLQIRFRL